MSDRRRPRPQPLYPRLAIAAALGAALVTTGCGPADELEGLLSKVRSHERSAAPDAGAQPIPVQGSVTPDAGTQPIPPDFMGGGMPYEVLPDGGLP